MLNVNSLIPGTSRINSKEINLTRLVELSERDKNRLK